jgi:hypothetical protein
MSFSLDTVRIVGRRRTKRGALGTMDTLLSITAGALFLIGSITIFNKAMSKTAERTMANQATMIVQSVRTFYQNQASYDTTASPTSWAASVTNPATMTTFNMTPVLVNSRQLLNEMNNGSNLRNAFGGTWVVNGMLDAFSVTATNIPAENCSAILATLNTSDLRHMRVVSGGGMDACLEGGTTACPATPSAITDACVAGTAGGVTTIRLVYR